MQTNIIMTDFPLKEESYNTLGLCMEVHRVLGHGFLEIVYKDAIEWELRQRDICYCREREYRVEYKGVVLPHTFFADFVVYNNIILEIKAAEAGLSNAHISQTLNYLKISGCKVGLLINFARERLEYKRLIF
ncbi:MAG: GxxExxY protein [Chitinophagaceae bacterium]